jgi:hypothetical protein
MEVWNGLHILLVNKVLDKSHVVDITGNHPVHPCMS